MRRVSHVLVAATLTTSACVGNIAESEHRIGNGGPWVLDAAAPGSTPTPGSTADGGFASIGADGGPLPNMPWSDGGTVQPPFEGDGGAQPGTNPPVDAGSVAAPTPENPCGTGDEPLATDLRVREIALYQTVKVALYKDNAWVSTRNAAVVQGKKSFVRAFVEPLGSFTARALRAVLILENEGVRTVLTADKTINRASSDEDTASTFDFPVDGALIGGSTRLSLSVIEATCPQAARTGDGARVPEDGAQALDAERIGKLRVVLVPVRLNSFIPDTSAAQVERIRESLLAFYPVADVEVSVREPLVWANTVAASGSGWAELLNQIGRLRQGDRADRDVYYFGLVNPAETFRLYCRTSCVLGLAPQTTSVSAPNQIGLGIGFADDNTYGTVIHELGHAHGLPHAPCVPRGGSIQGADPRYPYAGGGIGSWGWDSRTSMLKAPSAFVDIMGYCDPTWISDYFYEALARRCRAVNTSAYVAGSDKQSATAWTRIIWAADGFSRWADVTTTEVPGELTTARALGVDGEDLGSVSIALVPLSHSDDSFLYIPEPDPSWAALEIGSRTLVLSEIAPAL